MSNELSAPQSERVSESETAHDAPIVEATEEIFEEDVISNKIDEIIEPQEAIEQEYVPSILVGSTQIQDQGNTHYTIQAYIT